MPKRVPRYTPEFKQQVIKEVIDGKKSVVQVARDFDISPKTLGPWVADYRKKLRGRPDRKAGAATSPSDERRPRRTTPAGDEPRHDA